MKEQVDEDMLIRYITNEVSDEEHQKVDLWINASAINAHEFEQVKFILESGKELAQKSPADESAQWEKFKLKREQSQQTAKVQPMNSNWRWLQIASALIILIGSAAVFFYLQSGQAVNSLTATIIRTQNNVRSVTLPDGSIIALNRYSNISYREDFKKKREISLNGEAFFDVKHDASIPFIIKTKNISIQDIGTAFNVRNITAQVEVIVERGIVRVSNSSSAVTLNAREKISLSAGDKKLHVEPNTDLLYNYYRSNEFVANHTPLSQLVETLNDAYNAHIIIQGNELRDLPLTVTLKKQSLDTVLQVIISTTPEIHIIKNNGNIILKKD